MGKTSLPEFKDSFITPLSMIEIWGVAIMTMENLSLIATGYARVRSRVEKIPVEFRRVVTLVGQGSGRRCHER